MFLEAERFTCPKTTELLETIKLKNGGYFNLSFHEERIERAYREIYGCKPDFILEEVLPIAPPREGIFRVRLKYPGNPIPTVEIIPYVFPSPESLKLVQDPDIVYDHKYGNRDKLNSLRDKVREEHGVSDFLLASNGFVTDTSISNVVFETREGEFVTPDTCLLPGTKRSFLLAKKTVRERPVRPRDIHGHKKLYFINAMIDIEDDVSVPVEKIIL
ncbi:MAG: aminotransferase class IV [Deltaproteobacteria bacterium]|jgi:4-amino-4-deoxychorismate lyase|nr:aminotransferase class IV [Deltaproteobacteria bacterium]